MKSFTIKILLFFIPILLVFILINYIFFRSGEFYTSMDEIVMNDEKYLIGYIHNEESYKYLKWYYLKKHTKKTIVALGSSRVLQFRSEMFDSSFYNAGYTVSSISDFQPFLEGIPKSKLPDYLILGLDQWMFNKNFDDLNRRPLKNTWKNSFSFFPSPNAVLDGFKKIIKGEYNDVFCDKSENYFGLNAITEHAGFRKDGSMFYGVHINKLVTKDSSITDFHFKDTYERIKNGNRRFEYSDTFHIKSLLILKQLLKFCSTNNIKVIAFLPPFADKVYNKMILSKKYNYLLQIEVNIKPIFEKYHYEFYDFSNVSSCNSSDEETLDGFHGGEATYAKILIKMLETGSELNKITKINKLRNDLTNRKNNYLVYSYI